MSDDHITPLIFYTSAEKQVLEQILLANLKSQHDALAKLLLSLSDHAYEDTIYRYYAHSYKLYCHTPHCTNEIVSILRQLAPSGTHLCVAFEQLVQVGIHEKPFSLAFNEDWSKNSRPYIESFFHARFFLEMAVKYGASLDSAALIYLPSGWAALLCLYDIR